MLNVLAKAGLIHQHCITATGKTVGENIRNSRVLDPAVIRKVEDPYHKQGGLAVLFGNLAPDGCVVQTIRRPG